MTNPYYATLEEVPDLPANIGDAIEYSRPHPTATTHYLLTKTADNEWRLTRDAPFEGVAILSKSGAAWFEFDGQSKMGPVQGSDDNWRFLLDKMF